MGYLLYLVSIIFLDKTGNNEQIKIRPPTIMNHNYFYNITKAKQAL